MTPPPAPPAGLRERVLADVAKAPAARPGAWQTRALAAGGALGLWCAAALLVLGLRRDWGDLPAPYATGTLALLGLGAVSLTWVALARGNAMVGPPVALALGAVTALPPLLAAVSMALVAPGASSAAVDSWADLLRASAVCEVMSVGLALPLLALLLLLKRGLLFPTPALVGAALGAASATWAHALVHLHCPLADRWHLLLGHALPTLPLMVVGAALGLVCFRGTGRPTKPAEPPASPPP